MDNQVAIVGGGICGLALALNLHARGIACRVFETAPEIKEIGVGITLLPHAIRELAAFGLQPTLEALGIENKESRFFNRFGQSLYAEPRGRYAGYPFPEIGIHRGKLHGALYKLVVDRLGPDAVVLGRRCVGVEQAEDSVTLRLEDTVSGAAAGEAKAAVAIACDGVNSTLRRQFYPDDKVAFTGINTWRGVTCRKPILDGRTYLRIGSLRTCKMVIYPIVDDFDGKGNQLINWVAEVQQEANDKNDWNLSGKVGDVLPFYADWKFDWLDVPALIQGAESILEYPMVDKEPIDRWSFGRVTLAGDAAHPMYPRGSNGSAQALIDARVLADQIAEAADPVAALRAYEAIRAPQTAKVVRTNRATPPDAIIMAVEDATGDRPFDNLDDHISQAELQAISDRYKQVAGFSLENFAR
jgi:2-polyprenyl-6-methoxyphenol hydroxylase-like FAD-dependent oxidoreductase